MCGDLLMKKTMENYWGSDLNDIIRAGGAGGGTEWQQFPSSDQMTAAQPPDEDFGDPFGHLRDPLLHVGPVSPPGLFPFGGIEGMNTVAVAGHGILDDEIRRPSNIFSRMLHISAVDSPALLSVHTQPLTTLTAGSSRLAQIPSPPPNTGTRRRKGQAKKVVCIPAPAPANSRPTGEIVPSDLWAWRKYGQKPIKGSPYPRGYYRCSSSKGCLARKQVERSRTDPNMLVITYTSEHNHPWPTQRNALAGSTRSQPFKTKKAKDDGDQQKGSAAVKAAAAEDQLELEEAEEFDQAGFPDEPEESLFADLGEIEADTSLDFDPISFYDDWSLAGRNKIDRASTQPDESQYS